MANQLNVGDENPLNYCIWAIWPGWIISVASQPILLPPMHQAGQTHCNLAWLRTMACNKLWRNSTHSLEASSQSQKDWGLGNFRRLCFQFPSSPFCWSSVPEYLVDHPPWIQSSHSLMELGAGTLFSLWPEGLSNHQMWYQDLYTGIAIHTNSLKEEAAKNYVTMRDDRSQPYVRASTHVTFITGARWPNQRRKAMITMHCCRHFQFYEREITIMHGKGRLQWKKKTFSFGHCPNHLNPPPMTPIRATWSSFFGSRNSRFESQFRT